MSVVLFLTALLTGDVRLYLVVIVPVMAIHGPIGVIALILFVAGLGVLFFSLSGSGMYGRRVMKDRGHGSGRRGASWGGVVFLGPIPVVFGSRDTLRWFPRWTTLLLIGITFMIISYLVLILLIAFLR